MERIKNNNGNMRDERTWVPDPTVSYKWSEGKGEVSWSEKLENLPVPCFCLAQCGPGSIRAGALQHSPLKKITAAR